MKATTNIIDFVTQKLPVQTKEEMLNEVEFISFKNINFSFDESKKIFFNFSCSFKNKHAYAIIGKTGSGKSTLIDLMMRFKTPNGGQITINDVPIENLHFKLLKEKIIYLSQESIIFNDTIKNNLSMDKHYEDEAIMEVLTLVELDELIREFKDGLNHLLNYKGTNISGGQKQRLNIARALLRTPDVLILDESINALDSETRIRIVKKLLRRYHQKMIIFITHDRDILGLVDIIVDLDKKRVENNE